jgi:hypothetical protein
MPLRTTSAGDLVASAATKKVGFYGTTPAVQPSGANQAAGLGISIITIPITLAQITGAGDVLTNFTPGFAGKILRVAFAVSTVVTTAAKAVTLNLEIGTTNVTGGAVALTSANCTPLGAVVAGSAITAANAFTASDTISVEAASVTAFSEGAGYLLITVSSDAHDAVRDGLVTLGLLKGSA